MGPETPILIRMNRMEDAVRKWKIIFCFVIVNALNIQRLAQTKDNDFDLTNYADK